MERGFMLTHLSILKKGLLLVLAPLLFQLIFIGLANKSQRLQRDSDQRTNQAKEVLRQSEEVLNELLSMETGIRGFALTGNPVFADPFESAVRELPGNLQKLKALASDSPQLHASIIFDRRSFVQWLLDPVLSIRGRS